MKLVAATGNRGKLEEFRRILGPLGVEVLSAGQAGAEIKETGKTFEENALIKALAVCRQSGLPAVGDDSGLEVEALGGAPGIYSARYAGPCATDADRCLKLLRELEGLPAVRRGARFVCAVCCVFPGGEILRARGECEGIIAFAPDGAGGFGYDPIFIEKSSGLTFARMNGAQKDAVSHRGKALRALARKLREYMQKTEARPEP